MSDPAIDNALTSFQTRGGKTVIFAAPGNDSNGRPNWDPEVALGQPFEGPPPYIYRPVDILFTNQLISMKDAAMMERIKKIIENNYAAGVAAAGKDIHSLSPRDAMELSRKILAERTEYDYSTLIPSGAERLSKITATLQQQGSMPLSQFHRMILECLPPNDGRDVESLLKIPDDKDVVCRNQCESIVVIFEAIKQLQKPETSRLNTTTARLFANEVDPHPVLGQLVGTLGNAFVYENKKDMIAYKVDREPKQQEQLGVHDFGEGKVWILSPEERQKVILQNDRRPFIRDPEQGHALVQFITLDRDGRYRVLVINSTDESDKADVSAMPYVPEALLAWQQDATWGELRKAHEKLLLGKQTKQYSLEWYALRHNLPLLIINQIKEERRKLAPEETQWCQEIIAYTDKALKDKANWLRSGDGELVLDICKLCTEAGDYALAEKALAVSKDPNWPSLVHEKKMSGSYNARVALAEKVLRYHKEAVAPFQPVGMSHPKAPQQPTDLKATDLSEQVKKAIAGSSTKINPIFPFYITAAEHTGDAPVPQQHQVPRNSLGTGDSPSSLKP